MTLTNKQQEALKIAVERFKAHEPYTCITGYAGSGKSTCLKFIIAALGINPETEVCYATYTGKAAMVLQQKGCPNAMTLHKLLFKAKQNKNGTYTFFPREELEGNFKVICVDEVSMVEQRMWNLLMRHHIYVIALGDPGQLSPVSGNQADIIQHPHIFLDEIMRQALDSEIIRCSMWLREQKPIRFYPAEEKEVKIVNNETDSMLLWADQILCATNKRRIELNNRMRFLLGKGEKPEVGDKIICLHNQWNFASVNGNALTNGCIGIITDCFEDYMVVPSYIVNEPIPILCTTIETPDGDIFENIPIDYTYILTGKKFLTPEQEYKMRKYEDLPDPPFEFTYGYAITCHRAQGSEWEKILVFEEFFPTDKEEHFRWLYSAITRASKKLVMVKK